MCSENQTCVICLDQINPDDLFQVKCCNKYYHKSCLHQWIELQNKFIKDCPHCRNILPFISNIKHQISLDLNQKIKNQYNIIYNYEKYTLTDIYKYPSRVIIHNFKIGSTQISVPIFLYTGILSGKGIEKPYPYYITMTALHYLKEGKIVINQYFFKKYFDLNINYIDVYISSDDNFYLKYYNIMKNYNLDLSYKCLNNSNFHNIIFNNYL